MMYIPGDLPVRLDHKFQLLYESDEEIIYQDLTGKGYVVIRRELGVSIYRDPERILDAVFDCHGKPRPPRLIEFLKEGQQDDFRRELALWKLQEK